VKIDTNRPVQAADPGPVRTSPARTDRTAAPIEDHVELSGPSATTATDPARVARIEAITVQVQQGTYKVSAEDIARGILDEMLGGKPS